MDFDTEAKGKKDFLVQLYCNPDEIFDSPTVNDRFRLLLIRSGAGVISIDGSRILFNSPAVFCLNEKEEVKLLENSDVKAASVYFYPGAINSALDFDKLRGNRNDMLPTERNDCTCLAPFYIRTESYHGQLNVGLAIFRQISHVYDTLFRELTGQPDGYWPCRSRSYLIEILFLLQKVYLSPDSSREILLNANSDLVGRIMVYLHSNYSGKITLDELSTEFNLNRTTLNEKFKDELGMTVINYLIELRIQLACMILSDTLIPVAEIAERVGFADVTHFNRTFRKLMKHSPSEYRQINSWQLRQLA
jgi:AraC family L-rhamnose operon regulatory protein RhaS